MSDASELFLGRSSPIGGERHGRMHLVPPHHLVTHGVALGMTGSGKTGLMTVLLEETLNVGVPVFAIDVKGDLANLLLSFPNYSSDLVRPFALGMAKPNDKRSIDDIAKAIAAERREGLNAWGIGEPQLTGFRARTALRVITPGSTAGEPLHLLSSLEVRSSRWDTDIESARASLSAAISLVLRLLGRDPDSAKSREHVVLAVFAERRLRAGKGAELEALMSDLAEPPLTKIGALEIDAYLGPADRASLAQALNSLLASPTFATWRTGAPLDIAEWMRSKDGRTPGVVLSVAHLGELERTLVLGIVLDEVLEWVRSLPGSSGLRALICFDEVYGFLPPHPQNPPTKRPIVSLMKQARAFGVGVVVATQNPMDLDYRALSNAGMWWIGRLSTDADRERVLDGMALDRKLERSLAKVVGRLLPRWFIERDVHADRSAPLLLQPRWAMSLLRGPMTRVELALARNLVW